MSEIKDQSLDDTLKELLEEDKNKSTKNTEVSTNKPKRKRRTKAQIEADKLAEKTKTAQENLQTAANESKAQEVVPEVIPDKPEDLVDPTFTETDDVENIEVPEPETLEPEIIPDTEVDVQPDVAEEKEPPKPRTKSLPGEIFETLRAKKDVEPKSKYVGKSCVVFNPTPTYRAPHASMRMKPYRGFITIIEDPKDGFVKVQFLRQGFGLCTAYMDAETIIDLIGGDENVIIQEK